MGASMCGHLLLAGFAVTLTTRTRAKADPLLARGAAWADSPADVAAGSDIVFTMLGYPTRSRRSSSGRAACWARSGRARCSST